jgi:hypothetical protein
MATHIDTEKYIEKLAWAVPGFGYTVVREGLYSESYPLYTSFFDPKQLSSEIKIPHDVSGPGIAWVKREELGEGTSKLIKRFVESPDTYKYRNTRVLLSGQKMLTLAETVKILSSVAGTPVSIRRVSNEEYAALPQNVTGFTYKDVSYSYPWTTSFEAFRRGEASYVSPLFKELLGREPEDSRRPFEACSCSGRVTTCCRKRIRYIQLESPNVHTLCIKQSRLLECL